MVVQKFGGTSVADPDAIRRLLEIVRTARARDGRGPAVVVSAMSKVTDTLLGLAADAGQGRVIEALAAVDVVRERHLAAAQALAPDDEALTAAIHEETSSLGAIVSAETNPSLLERPC